MKGKKLLCLMATVALAGAVTGFAEEAKGERQPILSDQTKDALSNAGAGLLSDIQDALQKAGDTIDKKVKSAISKVCLGSWRFVNGKCATTITCLEDGSMEVVQKNNGTTTTYRGTYEATLTQLEFNVKNQTVHTLFTKKSDARNELWTIYYRLASDDTLRVYSESIPDDGNGYDFSAPTLFSAVK